MDIRFAEPLYLLLLLTLPVFWIAAGRLRLVGKVRRRVMIVLRTLIVTCLVLALAQLEWTKTSKDMTVFFVIDQSESVPAQVREQSAQIVNELVREKKKDDEIGLIIFGTDPSIETMPVPELNELDGSYKSIVDPSQTNISSALRLALSAFPNDSMTRIVLITDGNENSGSALETARFAANNNVPIDVVPLRYKNEYDVRIDKIIVPQNTQKDQPFELKIFPSMTAGEASADGGKKSVTGTLRVFEDGVLIAEETITVEEGKNAPLVLPRRLTDSGFHRYEATFEAPGDTRSQNNTARGFTNLIGEPRVLYVEGDSSIEENYLAGALQLEDINVTLIPPGQIPFNIEELQSYDSMILSNVHAGEMSAQQMKMIERAVHDLGLGLVMIGGENSFGAGGYQDTPIEAALPVSMDVKQKKVLPNGALVILLHTVEMPSGNTWAREISLAALGVLSEQDYFGLMYYGAPSGGGTANFGGYGETWLWEPGLQVTGDKRIMRREIMGVAPMDVQTFDPQLQMAYDELKRVKTQAKHIVIISDGDPSPPNKALVQKIRDEGITVSTIGIAPHQPQDLQNLEFIANWGSGEFYYPKTPNELPRIFVKEASIVRRSLIFEETFFPVSDAYSEVMDGISSLPSLDGYVVTSDKDLSTIVLRSDKDDPLLAQWRYGLGKTVAFTSDAKNKWASQWVDWQGFSQFWSQTVRWSMREASSSNLQVSTEISDGRGKVVVDALDIDGDFENFLEFDTTVLGPNMEPQNVRVKQVGPGRYEGDFEASDVGTYMVRLNTGDEDAQRSAVAGAALSYSPEHETSQSNDNFIQKIAEESRGTVAGSADYNAFRPTATQTRRPKPLWEWLLLLGMLLIPIDVFVRRVYLDIKEVLGFTKNALLFWKPKTAGGPEMDTGMGSLLATKSRVKTKQDKKAERAAEQQAAQQEFRERLSRQKSDGDGDKDSVFNEADKAGSSKPVRHSSKHTVSDGDGNASQGGLSSLKKAKERAKKKM